MSSEGLETDQGAIALCLSGGGFRATLFHLGLIRALRSTTLGGEMALKAVREVYAVSGGSILAAHLLANYEAYVGSNEEFAKVERKLLDFAARNVRNRVLRRWPFRFATRNGRGALLQTEYDRFLERRTIGECYANVPDAPEFHFLTTSFTTGALCSFSGTRFEQVDRAPSAGMAATAADGIPLAFAVAASSAFPPMFPPILLTPKALGTDGKAPFNADFSLSDGGVYDNYGVEKFRLMKRTSAGPGILIVSGAGGSFATDPNHKYSSMLSRNIRASDILMRRVGEATLEGSAAAGGAGLVLVGIGDTVRDPLVAETTQQRVRLVRTDLDRFDAKLAELISGHGERIGRAALAGHRFAEGAQPTFAVGASPSARSRQGEERAADRTADADAELLAATRGSWRGLLFDPRDPLLVAFWWLVAAAAAALLVYLGMSYWEARQAEKSFQDQLVYQNAVQRASIDRVAAAALAGDLAEIRRELKIATDTNQDLLKQAQMSTLPRAGTAAQAIEQAVERPAIPALPQVQYPQRVYIQFAGNLTRAKIVSLNQALREAGWAVQGTSGERLEASQGRLEVRFEDGNGKAAAALAEAINRAGLPIGQVKAVPFPVGSNLEVWISN